MILDKKVNLYYNIVKYMKGSKNNLKKFIIIFMSLLLAILCLTGCSLKVETSTSTSFETSESVETVDEIPTVETDIIVMEEPINESLNK